MIADKAERAKLEVKAKSENFLSRCPYPIKSIAFAKGFNHTLPHNTG